MSEPTQQPIEPMPNPNIELETLRRVNAELLAKAATRKAKIAEMEAAAVALQGKLTESESTVHELSVTRPLKAIAESISIAPDVFLDHLTKSYRVEVVKGELVVAHARWDACTERRKSRSLHQRRVNRITKKPSTPPGQNLQLDSDCEQSERSGRKWIRNCPQGPNC